MKSSVAQWRSLCLAAQFTVASNDEKMAEQASELLLRAALVFAELPLIPEVVCLCGSTRHLAAFLDWQKMLTMNGYIVVTIGCVLRAGDLRDEAGEDGAPKVELDELHKRKIDLADTVMVLDVDGYVGDSTRSEVEYAEITGKKVVRLSEAWPDYAVNRLEDALFGTFSIRVGCRYDDLAGCHVGTVEVDRG